MGIFSELKRRNVIKVAISYLVLAWVVIQVTAIAVPALHLPHWVNTLVFFFGAIGFPFALFFTWTFELTPEGIKRSREVEASESITHLTGRKLDFVIIGLLIIAVVVLLIERQWKSGITDQPSKNIVADIPTTIQQTSSDETSENIPASIAVLPFVNMSSDPEQEYFSDGITDEILNYLVKVTDLRVVARTSSFAFKGKNIDLRDIGAQLGVEYLLEGSIRKYDNDIRITAQLISVKDGMHLWSETYAHTLDDVFLVQSEIAQEIARELRINLDANGNDAIQVVSPDAHNFYLLGLERLKKGEYQPYIEAREYFVKALEVEPNYIDAQIGLANSLIELFRYGNIEEVEFLPRFKAAIDKLSTMVEPDHPSLLVFKAYFYVVKKEFELSSQLIDQAYQIAPNNPDVVAAYIIATGFKLTDKQKLDFTLQQLQSDPLNLKLHMALASQYQWVFYEYEKAYKVTDDMERIDPEYSGLYLLRTRIAISRGNMVKALQMALLTFEKDRDDPEGAAQIALLYAQLGFYDQAEYYIKVADSLKKDTSLAIGSRIYLLWAQNKNQEAFELSKEFIFSERTGRFWSDGVPKSVYINTLFEEQKYDELTSYIYKNSDKIIDNRLKIIASRDMSWRDVTLAVQLAHLLKAKGDESYLLLVEDINQFFEQWNMLVTEEDIVDNTWFRMNMVDLSEDFNSLYDDLLASHKRESMLRYFALGKGFISPHYLSKQPKYIEFEALLNQEMERQRNIIIDQHPELIDIPMNNL
ncbi:hypothetical protein [Thalassotalea agarivorans]|uniref:TolB amino-terminal domain-containing protein n=1 Tax=Thalassotalea agarivorans TaxID=349064 RepID=A0A1I0CCX4_THASX|nr:hypothetical protein [Thalassotalea agarivorans]SET17263.1 TolB amino-terminal domain-containing protein [Thalassotalea agarivorans]